MSTSIASLDSLCRPRAVAQVMREFVPLPWDQIGGPRHVRVERFWPAGRARFAFEWSFEVDGAERHSLHGLWRSESGGDERSAEPQPVGPVDPRLTRMGVRGIHICIPGRNLVIHSADCDTRMAHLSTCLDGKAMAPRLAAMNGAAPSVVPWDEDDVSCRLLGYRAGRRAAILYRHGKDKREGCPWVGKTYRDDRGERLLDLHARVGAELARTAGGRVGVPSPIAYDPELRMAVFEWARGRTLSDVRNAPNDGAKAAIEALGELHGVALDDLPRFDAAHECAIVKRWHQVLQAVDGGNAAMTERLASRLTTLGASLGETRACTIHRDCYEKQFVAAANAVILLDLDTLAYGSPCVDVGNYLAHLLLNILQRGGSVAEFGPHAECLVRWYEACQVPLDRRALAFYLSSALYRLGAVHSLRTLTRGYVETLWQVAEDQLALESFDAGRWNSAGKWSIKSGG